MTDQSFQALLAAFLSEFPDETLSTGQRLKKRQVEIMNAVIIELKERNAGRK